MPWSTAKYDESVYPDIDGRLRDIAERLRDIALAQAEAGDIDGALATDRGIAEVQAAATHIFAFAQNDRRLGWALPEPDDFRAEYASFRADALSAVARAQVRAGDIDGALASARSISGDYQVSLVRTEVFHGIAHAQAAAGDIDGALAKVRSIHEDSLDRAAALRGVAEAQAAAGDAPGAVDTFCEALACARNIESYELCAEALYGIAAAQAAAGDAPGAADAFSEALACTGYMQDDRCAEALGAIAETLVTCEWTRT